MSFKRDINLVASQFEPVEEMCRSRGFVRIFGVDEAGRGPLAGPVVAASLYFKGEIEIPDLNDSKKLSAAKREKIFELLTTSSSVEYGVGIATVEEIDSLNILQASLKAMVRSFEALNPDYLLIDGNKMPKTEVPGEFLIKGDSRSPSIAGASIIAKVIRDRFMMECHEKWPEYGFNAHMGYGTKKHREAIDRLGPCPIHRKSFEPIKSMVGAV